MKTANLTDIESFLKTEPDTQLLELLMPDINGIFRCKRIHRREFNTLFEHNFKAPMSTPLLGITGVLYDDHLDRMMFAVSDRAHSLQRAPPWHGKQMRARQCDTGGS